MARVVVSSARGYPTWVMGCCLGKAVFPRPRSVYEPVCGFSEVFDTICDDELADYAPVLRRACELGKGCSV